VLLFFRYGMTPTANKLYQLVRKGSMTAPAEALNKFWEDLREKSRVRIEHPDLPEALKTAAGDLTATLWSTAQALAHETLVSYRSEAQAAVVEAKAALSTVESERDALSKALREGQQTLSDTNERISILDQQLAAAGATNLALESQVQQAKTENAAHLQRLDDARRDFTAELDKLHAAAQLADERFRAAETRALLEIDRERSAGAKLQKELNTARTEASQSTERHRTETAAIQTQLGDLRQKIGMLEGNLQAAAANKDLIANELKAVQVQLADAMAQASTMRNDAEKWRHQAKECQRIAAELRESTKPQRASRKPKAE
ncbi:DNA-binding protein, partial [Collimonas antrihumi]|uniref:DNA-binding protein n=1 Tax=Collimonas antrihumi TaxID=1940615 RepID=UPI001B8AD74A